MTPMVSPKSLAALAAAALAFQSTVAAAQQACITEDEVSAMAIYAMPRAVEGVRLRCNGQLSANGFLARRGDAFAARYTSLQERTWPRAKAALFKFGAGKASKSTRDFEMFANLPDTAVRPLIDALIVQEVSSEVKPQDCGKIERFMEALAPIEPEDAARLLGVIAGLANLNDPPVCARRS